MDLDDKSHRLSPLSAKARKVQVRTVIVSRACSCSLCFCSRANRKHNLTAMK
ncbi:unnamed protein product, partial [Nesidiocoris tenuis]